MNRREAKPIDTSAATTRHPTREDICMDLLMEIVQLAKQEKSYRHLLPSLRAALDKCPEMKEAVFAAMNRLV